MTELDMVLGTMNFGTKLNEEDSRVLLDHFVEAGGTRLDTADCYSFGSSETGFGGQSERLIGRWLAARPGLSDQVFLSTKVGAQPTEKGGYPTRIQGLSAKAIKAGIEGSLQRLGLDRVEMYWTHMADRAAVLDETVAALNDLVAESLVERLGVSNHPLWMVERARRIAAANAQTGYTAIQHSYSYLQPRPFARIEGKTHRFGKLTDEMIDYVHSNRDMWAWAYTPLLEGAYSKPERMLEAYDHPGSTRRLAMLDQVASELCATRNQVVLAWLTGGQPRITPIVGVSTVAQLDEALTGLTVKLDDEQRHRLDTTT